MSESKPHSRDDEFDGICLNPEHKRLVEQLESAKRDGLRLRERLDQAEAFIEHQDMSYRYEEWLGEDQEDDSIPASRGES